MINEQNILTHVGQIWSMADTLRGEGIVDANVPKSMMPLFALMMVDSRIVREVEEKTLKLEKEGYSKEDIITEIEEDMSYYNSMIIREGVSIVDICQNDNNFMQNLDAYIKSYDSETQTLLGYSENENDLEYLNLKKEVNRLQKKKILYSIVKQWAAIPFKEYNNSEITTYVEHIKRKWADISAGQHYTPSDIIDLIQKISLKHIDEQHNEASKIISVYDPTCGGGNMLFGVEDKLRVQNPYLKIKTRGQEIDDELYALAKIESRFRIESTINWGNTLTTDTFEDESFDVIVANPPYGYSWKDQSDKIKERGTNTKSFLDKYPSESDGQLLFTQHILSKMKKDGYAIQVTNGSPLFSGGAGSGESEIRKWILDNNYIDALIQLPKNEFFNTGISTYLWILNKNRPENENRIKIIDASQLFTKLSKNKGDKSNEINSNQADKIVELLFGDIDKAEQNKDSICKIFDKEYFYFNKQSILLKHKDTNGKSMDDIIPINSKGIKGKSIILKDIQDIEISGKSVISVEIDELLLINTYTKEDVSNLQDKVKALQVLFKDKTEDTVITLLNGDIYKYDQNKESVIKISGEKSEILGNGIIKVSISYKKPNKTKTETYTVKVELLPKEEKDSEIIAFQEIQKGKLVKNDIDDFLAQWVEKDFDKLDNVVGVEINFNKIFYKYEKLRAIDNIVSDITCLEAEELEVDKDIFDFSPIDSSELNIEE